MAGRAIHLEDGTGYTACCGKAWSSLGLGAQRTEDPDEVTCPTYALPFVAEEELKQREGDQPLPIPQLGVPDVQTAVIRDIVARREVGIQRPGNGRDTLRDAYEEALDLSCYLKQLILERGAWIDKVADLEAEIARLQRA